jgi:hypothetical protein
LDVSDRGKITADFEDPGKERWIQPVSPKSLLKSKTAEPGKGRTQVSPGITIGQRYGWQPRPDNETSEHYGNGSA